MQGSTTVMPILLPCIKIEVTDVHQGLLRCVLAAVNQQVRRWLSFHFRAMYWRHSSNRWLRRSCRIKNKTLNPNVFIGANFLLELRTHTCAELLNAAHDRLPLCRAQGRPPYLLSSSLLTSTLFFWPLISLQPCDVTCVCVYVHVLVCYSSGCSAVDITPSLSTPYDPPLSGWTGFC